MDDFKMATRLMTEDTLIAAGLSPDAAKIRSTYEMGVGYISDVRSLVGSLKGMEGSLSTDDAPSPYEGLTVGEAREFIAAESKLVRGVISNIPEIRDMISNNPPIARRYIERVRLMGELEATKWLTNETNGGK